MKKSRKDLFDAWVRLSYSVRGLAGIVQNPLEVVEDFEQWDASLARVKKEFQELEKETVEFVTDCHSDWR